MDKMERFFMFLFGIIFSLLVISGIQVSGFITLLFPFALLGPGMIFLAIKGDKKDGS